MRNNEAFVGFHEGEFWKFKCSYKYKPGEVDRYRYVLASIPLCPLYFVQYEKDAIMDG